MKDLIFRHTVKYVLVEMAIQDTLPSDMSTLDIDEVFEKATDIVENDPNYVHACMLEKLAEFVSPDEEDSLESMLEILETHPDGSDITGWIDGITMCERYETSFTVDQLLEEITPYFR